MNDKTEQSMVDTLRRVAKSAMPYSTTMAGFSAWGNLFTEAADTIDTLRAENESLREQRNRIGLYIGHALSGGRKDDHEAGLSGRMDAIRALIAERNEWQASRIAYANEFPLNADGEPDVVNVHANIRSLKAQLAEAQRDSERLDWMIEQCAYVVSDPDCCDGYWLNYARPDGTMWTQATEHETPRAAIDAARGEKNGA